MSHPSMIPIASSHLHQQQHIKRALGDKLKTASGPFDGALFLHPKGAIVLSEKLPSSSASSALVLAVSSSRAARLKRSNQMHSRQQSSASSCSASSVSLVDSLSLTSTSTFPAAYTATANTAAEQPAASSSSSSPSSKRSASASSLPTAAAASSPAAHQRANTVCEQQMRGSLTPVQAASASAPPSPLSPPTPFAADPHCPPTQRKAQREEERKELDEGAEDVETRRLQPEKAEGEEDSEELTNTTLADASLPSSDDDSREKKWKPAGEGAGVSAAAAAGGGGGDDEDNDDEDDDDIDDSQRGVNCILSFLIDSVLASPATASRTREQLIKLSPQQLLAVYRLTLLPSPSVTALQAEVAALRAETDSLRAAAKDAELAALAESRRQVKAARAEMELKFAEETRRTKTERKDRKDRERERRRQAAVKEAAAVSASLSCIHSHSFHDASFDPTLSLTTDMLEPRTVTFTLAAHELPAAASASPLSPACVPHVVLALFSSSFSAHSLFSYIGQTERQPNAGGHIAFQRALTMREVRTWHAKDLLRVSAYDVTAAASSSARAGAAEAEESKDMLGQVLCDTYALFTSFTTERATYELLKAQEAVDAVLGYSEREISCSIAPQQQQGAAAAGSAGRISIHAIITPALTVDAYPPCPKGVRRSSLAVETSLSLSLISEAADGGQHHLSSSLAAISFQDPVSPILPLKAGRATTERGAGADSTKKRRASDGGSNSRPQAKQAVAVQCEAPHADEMATQTDRTAVMQRVMVDAATMTEPAVAAPPAVLAACCLPAVSIEPALTIVTASRRDEINSPLLSPVHPMETLHGSSSSPASPQPLSTAGPVTLLAMLAGLSSVLSVPLPQAELRLSAVSQQSLQRIVSLLRRQYSFSLQWFLDTTTPAAAPAASAPAAAAAGSVSGARTVRKPIWNPSINPSSSLQPKLFSTIRLHSHWQPDHTASGCSVCLLSFGLLKRKHHCRLCGMTACDDCTRKSVELAEVGLTGQQRVCDLCEIVWSVGRGLKTVGEKDRDAAREKEKETAAPAAPAAAAAAPAAAKAGKKAAEESKKSEEAAPSLLATPLVQRTGRKGSIKKEHQAALTASSSKRITRSAAAKENVHVNVMQPPGSEIKRRRQLTAPHTPAAAAAGGKRA